MSADEFMEELALRQTIASEIERIRKLIAQIEEQASQLEERRKELLDVRVYA